MNTRVLRAYLFLSKYHRFFYLNKKTHKYRNCQAGRQRIVGGRRLLSDIAEEKPSQGYMGAKEFSPMTDDAVMELGIKKIEDVIDQLH